MDITELNKLDDEELKNLAKKLDIDARLKRDELINQIENKSIERRVRMETEARAKVELEVRGKLEKEQKDLGITTTSKISPETELIESSKKVYAVFNNIDSPKAERKFFWGEKYCFHLFPNKVHVLPLALIKHLEKDCVTPVFENRTDKDGVVGSVLSKRQEKRFLLEVLGDAPKNAEFGIVLDDSILKTLQEVKYE